MKTLALAMGSLIAILFAIKFVSADDTALHFSLQCADRYPEFRIEFSDQLSGHLFFGGAELASLLPMTRRGDDDYLIAGTNRFWLLVSGKPEKAEVSILQGPNVAKGKYFCSGKLRVGRGNGI